ncbi:MAG: hypothetical protein J6E45_03945 [Prevotella sp.]|nr:hypothetical protein [Prevotella sp.]
MDRNALDWLFSTAPQALAALVGLIFAGVAFIQGAIDKEAGLDDSRADVCNEMKREIYANMKWLFWLAGISIVLDLILIVFNPIEDGLCASINGSFNSYLLIASIIILMNVLTLVFSLRFITNVAKPDFFEITVAKLSKDVNDGDVEVKDFVMDYIEMEKSLRALPIFKIPQGEKQPSVTEMLKELKYRQLIEIRDVNRLFALTRLRNLIMHGADITHVQRSNFDDLKKYKKMLDELKDNL